MNWSLSEVSICLCHSLESGSAEQQLNRQIGTLSATTLSLSSEEGKSKITSSRFTFQTI